MPVRRTARTARLPVTSTFTCARRAGVYRRSRAGTHTGYLGGIYRGTVRGAGVPGWYTQPALGGLRRPLLPRLTLFLRSRRPLLPL